MLATEQSLLGRRSTTATAEATAELRLELARSTTLALLASIAATVALAAATTATTTTLTVVTAQHATGRSVSTLLLDVRLGNDLGGEVKPFAEVV